ncbi:hypothetical protein [Halococcoides cellulosivorans]|uniref:hypothetical protein n=1 Tax=Halococcoides cellulosivorans TaxID=1679096 RepID=UPI00131EE2C5|nr:hypothetical protein [Halococcoides cellulosivorans]
MTSDRRHVLEAAGGTLATLVTGGVSGCLSLVDSEGASPGTTATNATNGTSEGGAGPATETTTAIGSADPMDWMPAGDVAFPDAGAYPVHWYDIPALRAADRNDVVESAMYTHEQWADAADTEWVVSARTPGPGDKRTFTILQGAYDRTTILDAWREEVEFDTEEYRGHTLLFGVESAETPGVFALADRRVVAAATRDREQNRAIVEGIIDAGTGNGPRYRATSDRLADVVGRVDGPRMYARVATGPNGALQDVEDGFPGVEAVATAIQPEQDRDGHAVLRFEDTDPPHRGTIEMFINEQRAVPRTWHSPSDLTIETDGRYVTVRARL